MLFIEVHNGPLPPSLHFDSFPRKVKKLGEALGSGDFIGFYKRLVSYHGCPNQILLEPIYPTTVIDDFKCRDLHPIEAMMAIDYYTYLPDDILTKVDRACMAVSLESRIPLLDHRIVEFSRLLPFDYKLRKGVGKYILRQVLYRYVPQSIIDRPKQGFSVPLEEWLGNELRDIVYELLSPARIKDQGLIKPDYIAKVLKDYSSKGTGYSRELWNILVFQLWMDKWI